MKSHRKIEGESFNSTPKPPEIKKAGEPDRSSLPSPSLKQKFTLKYRSAKQSLKNRVHRMFSKQTEKTIRKNIPDSSWYGKILFAILDVIPLPNLHEIWKAVQKEIPNGTLKEKLKLFWQKVDGVRTVASVAVSVLTAYFLAS